MCCVLDLVAVKNMLQTMCTTESLLTLLCPTCVVCSDVMQLGFSKPWPEAMTMITGQPKMSAQPLMEYFKPLIEWLEAENNKNNEIRGWPEYDWKPSEPSTSNIFML